MGALLGKMLLILVLFHSVWLAARYSARRRGFFTPFPRRFLGGSELVSRIRPNGLGPGYSDIFAGRIHSDPVPLENG
jgi:hypothetical protein